MWFLYGLGGKKTFSRTSRNKRAINNLVAEKARKNPQNWLEILSEPLALDDLGPDASFPQMFPSSEIRGLHQSVSWTPYHSNAGSWGSPASEVMQFEFCFYWQCGPQDYPQIISCVWASASSSTKWACQHQYLPQRVLLRIKHHNSCEALGAAAGVQ